MEEKEIASETPTSFAGWYPDPENPANMRFWSGTAWEGEPLATSMKKKRRSPMDKRARVALLLATALWVTALFLPAYLPRIPMSESPSNDVIEGWKAFTMGAMFFWFPLGPWAAWYANVFSGLAILTLTIGRAPVFRLVNAVLGVCVAPLAALFVTMKPDEGGSNDYAVVPGPALWLWLASLAFVLVAVVLQAKRGQAFPGRIKP